MMTYEESTSGKNRDNFRSLRSCDVRKVVGRIDVARREELSPVLHGQNAPDSAGVISRLSQQIRNFTIRMVLLPKQDTAKGNERPDEDGGSSRAIHVLGYVEEKTHSAYGVLPRCRKFREGNPVWSSEEVVE
jgi:hypothetical protein